MYLLRCGGYGWYNFNSSHNLLKWYLSTCYIGTRTVGTAVDEWVPFGYQIQTYHIDMQWRKERCFASSCCYKELESVGRNRRLFGLQVISLQLFGWACSLFTCQLRKSSYDIVLFIPLATPAILVEEESILAESLWLIFIIYIENSRVYCRPRNHVGLGFLFFTFCAHYVLLPSCHYTYDTVIRKDVFIMQP